MKSAQAIYREYLEKQKEEEGRKLKEMTEKEQRQKEILMNEKKTACYKWIAENEKFDEVLDYVPIDKNSDQFGTVMLKWSSTANSEAMKKQNKIKEQKKVETTMHKYLEV